MYAILDIETTGGKYNQEGITEIAIYQFDGEQITDQFISLINPQKSIQEYVVKLTGITNQMLVNAPKFYEVAKRIVEITDNCTIVAHNASFDYRMLRLEFERLGFDYQRDSICTVELSKQLLPEITSYKLGSLTKELGIPLANRHRASGDAFATYQLFKLLLTKDLEKNILKNNINFFDENVYKNRVLQFIDTAPTSTGLFYNINKIGEIIFVGKAANIKQELSNFYLKFSKKAIAIQKSTIEIKFETTGNQLFTDLLFRLEVALLQPRYNTKQKELKNKTYLHQPNCILVEAGRTIDEHAIVLIENKRVVAYGYTNLAYQKQHIDRLKKVLTTIENTELATRIVREYLRKHKTVKKVEI